MRLLGRLVPVAEITPEQRANMLVLMEQTYEGVSAATFQADLAEKHWVIMLHTAGGELCGFSTQMLLELEVEGRKVTALYSGDTVVARECWGDAALSHVWGNLALSLVARHAAGTLFWILISKGYKTYRFLPIFFHEFYPRFDADTPEWATAVIAAFGRRKFPQAFDAAAGVIHAYAGKDRLRGGVADLTPGRLRDLHVAFFARCNPGHAAGDELCCVAPLSRENFTAAAYRMIDAKASATEVAE